MKTTWKNIERHWKHMGATSRKTRTHWTNTLNTKQRIETLEHIAHTSNTSIAVGNPTVCSEQKCLGVHGEHPFVFNLESAPPRSSGFMGIACGNPTGVLFGTNVRVFMVNALTFLFRLEKANAHEHCCWPSHQSSVLNKNVRAFMVNTLTFCSIWKELPRVAPTLASQCACALLVAIPREFCSEQKC